jgi:uncharacterized protein YbbC (DUF1343 family)
MVRTGLDVLIHERQHALRSHVLQGRRIGLITHPAAVLPDLTGAVDALLGAGLHLSALFGMEHGFSAAAADGAAVGHGRDPRTGLPVYSLYGPQKQPTAEMLDEVDILLFDAQDVGVRFYTFISTLYYVLQAGGRYGKPVIVLDRPNPLTGLRVEGGTVAPDCISFVGIAPLPIRHGLTCGELAAFMNAEFDLGAELEVVPMQGWTRSMWFDETGLPWVPTSPAMPHLSTVTIYPGTCLLEGTNLSEGRGTALPFEILGAPWLDGYRLATELNACELPGVRFRGAEFEPSASKHAGQSCQGIQVHVTDRSACRPVLTGLEIVRACRDQAPQEFAFLSTSWEGTPPHFDLLAGTPDVRRGLAAGQPVAELVAGWEAYEAQFREQSRLYLIYGMPA